MQPLCSRSKRLKCFTWCGKLVQRCEHWEIKASDLQASDTCLHVSYMSWQVHINQATSAVFSHSPSWREAVCYWVKCIVQLYNRVTWPPALRHRTLMLEVQLVFRFCWALLYFIITNGHSSVHVLAWWIHSKKFCKPEVSIRNSPRSICWQDFDVSGDCFSYSGVSFTW